MPWEIEYEHVDLVEMEHVTGFIERTIKTRDGQPARHILKLLLGTDGLSTGRGSASSNLVLTADGELQTPGGQVVDARALQRRELERLTTMHEAGRAYARRRNLAHRPQTKAGR